MGQQSCSLLPDLPPTGDRSFYPIWCSTHSLLTRLKGGHSGRGKVLGSGSCMQRSGRRRRRTDSPALPTARPLSQPSQCIYSLVQPSFSKNHFCTQILLTWCPQSAGVKWTQEEPVAHRITERPAGGLGEERFSRRGVVEVTGRPE